MDMGSCIIFDITGLGRLRLLLLTVFAWALYSTESPCESRGLCVKFNLLNSILYDSAKKEMGSYLNLNKQSQDICLVHIVVHLVLQASSNTLYYITPLVDVQSRRIYALLLTFCILSNYSPDYSNNYRKFVFQI